MPPEPGPLTELAQALQDDLRKFNDDLSAAMRLISSDPKTALERFPELSARAADLEKRDSDLLSQLGGFGQNSLPMSRKHWNGAQVSMVLSQAMASIILAQYPEVKALIEKGRQMMMEPRDPQTVAAFDELEAQLEMMTGD